MYTYLHTYIGEMLVSPKPIKMMDCISNGLDTATTYDIIKTINIIYLFIYISYVFT